MPTDFTMPKLAMAMNEGTITEWLVADGDVIEKGQAILTVETEKVAYDLEAPESGAIRILVMAGETVPVDTCIAVIAATADELQAIDPEAGPAANEHPLIAPAAEYADRVRASPLARKIAAQRGVDLTAVTGSGPGGRIVKRDVVDAQPGAAAGAVRTAVDTSLTELGRIPVPGTPRAGIARRMMASLQSTAQLSSFWESDISELIRAREVMRERAGAAVSVNAFIIRAMSAAIADVPIANSALVDDEIVVYESVNVGIAVALPGKTKWDSALLVPVLRNVQSMAVAEIDAGMKDLVRRAREGSLTADETTGSTITMSSTAGIAPPGTRATPVLNMPNAVIVGPSTPQDKLVPIKGEVAVRTMLPVSMTFDHRVLDGEPAARFSRALHEYLENPALILV